MKKNNWRIYSSEQAEIIFVNSCSFIKKKEEEFLRLLSKKFSEKKDFQKLAVFGCLPATSTEKIAQISPEIIQFNRDLSKITEYFGLKSYSMSVNFTNNERLSSRESAILFINKYFLRDPGIKYRLKKDEIFHLKISDGCQGECSYCSERFTTLFKSRRIAEVMRAFNKGIGAGYRLFVLNADDTAAFGADNSEDITQLLAGILSSSISFHLAISEFNPRGLFIDGISQLLSDPRIIYITVPIQSGSDDILKKMKRPYQIAPVMDKIIDLKRLNPKLKINTHIIVGFPGESDEDFQQTANMIRFGLFDRIKVFEYSDRPGTEASRLVQKTPPVIIRKRRNIIFRRMLISNIKQRSISNILLNSKTLS